MPDQKQPPWTAIAIVVAAVIIGIVVVYAVRQSAENARLERCSDPGYAISHFEECNK